MRGPGDRSRGRGRSGRAGGPSCPARQRYGFGRESQELIFGAEFMLHRRFTDGGWQICEGTDRGHETDSGVHRYDRVHGFAVSAEEAAMIERDPALREAERVSRTANKQKSHMQTVTRWSVFERYVLTFHPSDTGFLDLPQSDNPIVCPT